MINSLYITKIQQNLISKPLFQEYYEGSKKSEELLAQARKTLEKLK